MRSSILAIAALSLFTFAAPAFAQDNPEEEVSDAVDRALWCGAAYLVAAEVAGEGTEDYAAADALADQAFSQAKLAMEADQIEAGEVDRIVQFYVDAAVADMTNEEAELRYTDDDCSALIAG